MRIFSQGQGKQGVCAEAYCCTSHKQARSLTQRLREKAICGWKPVSFDRTERDYAYSLQNQILEQIAENRSLRKDAVEVKFDLRGDPVFAMLDDFVASKVPVNVGYILRVCNISDPEDHCKLPSIVFTAIPEKDVFADSVIISSDLGDGSDEPVFSPKEVKLFFWEGM